MDEYSRRSSARPRRTALKLFTAGAVVALWAHHASACPCHSGQAAPGKARPGNSEWARYLETLTANGASGVENSFERESAPERVPADAGEKLVLPAPGGKDALAPWGGPDVKAWKAEAVLANAVSMELNEAWARPETVDAIAAVPVQMLRTEFRPYGDGQRNASVSLGQGWEASTPPMVAIWVKDKGGQTRFRVRFASELTITGGPAALEAQYTVNAKERSFALGLKKDAHGRFATEWSVPPDDLGWSSPTQSRVLRVRPQGSKDWFIISFRHPVVRAKELPNWLAPAQREIKSAKGPSGGSLPSVGPVIDPEQVSAQLGSGGGTAYQKLMLRTQAALKGDAAHAFRFSYNADNQGQPFEVGNIHGSFGEGGRPTAVGSGRTWLIEPPKSPEAPFKILYTCFQGRTSEPWPTVDPAGKQSNLSEEARFGVPTGGGWHEIGRWDRNYGETIINSLEASSIVVGYAFDRPGPELNYAYGLQDVATVRWLRPGEAQVTMIGEANWAYDQGKPARTRHNFHWFMFHQNRAVCTEEWVHPFEPKASNGQLGMRP